MKNLLEILNRVVTLSEEQQGDIQRYFEPLQLNKCCGVELLQTTDGQCIDKAEPAY
ncbi:MAG: hypothetical protein H7Z75_17015 [Ferruginibacter sp.]|nr:hypothetical protein [Cytophagales bacterium]